MRLIDADELMKKIREEDFMADAKQMKVTPDSTMSGFFWGMVQGIVDRMPTAYDPDKVVETLEDYTMWKELLIYDLNHRERNIIKKAIEIVKKGGVE